ncbi:MAG: hypothetical protein IPF47_08140 [Gemmatimonadetes bacterium]|nr:hypothetical protein [Gemmatimonadota bacterium]
MNHAPQRRGNRIPQRRHETRILLAVQLHDVEAEAMHCRRDLPHARPGKHADAPRARRRLVRGVEGGEQLRGGVDRQASRAGREDEAQVRRA